MKNLIGRINSICVYQAFNKSIAEEAVGLQTFGEHFKMDRMTWIKPSFLWMMYRSGWASKVDQEHVLRIYMCREGFEKLIYNGVISKYDENGDYSLEEWKTRIKYSDVRIQWDPERNIYGEPQMFRSLQIGIRNRMLMNYVNDWIVKIEDISEYVHEQKKLIDLGRAKEVLLPNEQKYVFVEDEKGISLESRQKISIVAGETVRFEGKKVIIDTPTNMRLARR